MGNREVKQKILGAIHGNDLEMFKKLIQKHPKYLNSPISEDEKSTAMTRAAYLDRPLIIKELHLMGADPNATGVANISALMWAAARGNIDSLKLLLSNGANPHQKGPHDMNATDFAILFGSYNTAFCLFSEGNFNTKSEIDFEEIKQVMKSGYVDYAELIKALKKNSDPESVPFFTALPQNNVELKRGGHRNQDAGETWGNWANKVVDSGSQSIYLEKEKKLNSNKKCSSTLESDILCSDLNL